MKSTDFAKPLMSMPVVLMLTVALCCLSCGSSKRTTKITDNSEEEYRELLKGTDSVASQLETSAAEVIEKEGETDSYWIVYDTEKPENPKTGRSPVVAEGGTKQRSKARTERESHSTMNKEVTTTQSIATTKTQKANSEVRNEESEKRNAGRGLGIVMVCVVVLFLLVAYKLKMRN